MSTEQFIIILAGVSAIIVFVLSHMKVSKVFKALLFILFPAIIICSTILQVSYLKKKETKETAREIKIDQIDTHIKASLTFEDYIEAARMNRQDGRTDEAIHDVECALERIPNSGQALNLLGVLYSEKGDIDSAIEQYTKIKKGLETGSITVGDTKNKALFFMNYGKAYAQKHMWIDAKEQYTNALSLYDGDLNCYVQLAAMLSNLAQWDELYSLCKVGLTKFPSSCQVYTGFGLACINLSRFDEGEGALLKAIQVDSTCGQSYLLLGRVYFLRKEYQKSASSVDRALQLDPTLTQSVESMKQKGLLQ
jgi:tetratricopeptide (TPR) repeat protein